MPYSKPSQAPDYIPAKKKAQWVEVWNSVYAKAKKDKMSDADAEGKAFQYANGVAKQKRGFIRNYIRQMRRAGVLDEAS